MTKNAWHLMDIPQVLNELNTDPHNGLPSQEVKNRLEKYGYNELKKEERVSPYALFTNQFKNTLIIILLIATILSILIGEVLDAAIIGLIVIFSAVLGFIQEYKAERALEALKKMLSPTITVLREGKEEKIPAKDLVPGDILILEAGDKIPADARLYEVHSLKCDEASLTGESLPVKKDIDPLQKDIPISDRKNTVFAGTILTYGRGKAVVTSTGMNTEFGKIAGEVTAAEPKKTPLEKRTDEIGKWLGIIAVSLCFIVAGISILREASGGKVDVGFIVSMVMFAVSLAVAAVPEALAAIVTGALAIGMHQMARRNALVRRMSVVETLGCATVICSDKTGTLTKGEMTARRIFTGGKYFEVTGVGYEPKGNFESHEGDFSSSQSLHLLLKGGILCSDAVLQEKNGKWLIKGDPTEGALVVAAAKANMQQAEIWHENPRIEEIPFSSERKRMVTIHQMKDGKKAAFMKGAPEVILEKCSYILEDGGIKKLEDQARDHILKVNKEMAQSALRILGIAYKQLPEEIVSYGEEEVENEMILLGLVGMMDPPREEAIAAVRVCRDIHLRTIMITGDHELTALSVAKEIGIYNKGDLVLTGEELEQMPEEEFAKIADKVTIYARISPMDKLKIVKAWKKKGEVVAMTGDGVNDAPALKHADIGIAMGITGTEVTKDASDMVLSDDNFATIVKAIERGRWIYDNIKKYLTYLLRANITEVAVIGGVVILLGPKYLPLLPAAILYINLATDGLPALALGLAPPDPDIMQRAPRDPKESVFSRDVRFFILAGLLIEIPFFYFLFFHELTDITHARTQIFFLFIIIELIIALNFRSLRYSIFKAPPHKWLILAIVWEIVLIAGLIQIPSVCKSFGILKPSGLDIGIIAGFGVVVFASMEVIKALLRRKPSTEG